LITGVGRGLGRGIALAFAREGAAARYPASMAPEAQGPQLAEPLTDGIEEVPRAIIQYVTRTGETACLDDARSGERFAADPYLLRQQPKSIVCLPIFIQARLLGILYLEHHLITDSFTLPRLALLQVLASQLAMS
jgi:GAF domain-containing protein